MKRSENEIIKLKLRRLYRCLCDLFIPLENDQRQTKPNQTECDHNQTYADCDLKIAGEMGTQNAPADQRTTQRRSKRHKKKHPTKYQARKWGLCFNGLLVLITAIYSVVSIGQWRATERATQIAAKGIRSAENTTQMDERAWLGTLEFYTSPAVPVAGQPFQLTARWQNFGKTPAKNVRSVSEVQILPNGVQPTYLYKREDIVRLQDVFPGVKTMTNAAIIMRAKPIPETGEYLLDASVAENLTEGSTTLYFHGLTVYDDIFNHTHWTEFSVYLGRPLSGAFRPCSEHNECGDGTPQSF